jgi:hypothetical protein
VQNLKLYGLTWRVLDDFTIFQNGKALESVWAQNNMKCIEIVYVCALYNGQMAFHMGTIINKKR